MENYFKKELFSEETKDLFKKENSFLIKEMVCSLSGNICIPGQVLEKTFSDSNIFSKHDTKLVHTDPLDKKHPTSKDLDNIYRNPTSSNPKRKAK